MAFNPYTASLSEFTDPFRLSGFQQYDGQRQFAEGPYFADELQPRSGSDLRMQMFGALLSQLATVGTPQWNPMAGAQMTANLVRQHRAHNDRVRRLTSPQYIFRDGQIIERSPEYVEKPGGGFMRNPKMEFKSVYSLPQERKSPFGTGLQAGAIESLRGRALEQGMTNEEFDQWAAEKVLQQQRSFTDAAGNVHQTTPWDLTAVGGPAGGGPEMVTTKPPSQFQQDNRGFFRVASDAHDKALQLEAEGVEIPRAAIEGYLSGRGGPIKELLLQSGLDQTQLRYLDLIMDSGMVKLRDESGAALGDQEIARQLRQLIIASGDSAARKKDKRNRRFMAIQNYWDAGGQWGDEQQGAWEAVQERWDQFGLPEAGGAPKNPAGTDDPRNW